MFQGIPYAAPPVRRQAPRPVMVRLHGGDHEDGEGAMYGAERPAARGGVVSGVETNKAPGAGTRTYAYEFRAVWKPYTPASPNVRSLSSEGARATDFEAEHRYSFWKPF
ncbi:hypothetical protein ACWGI0_24555 [Streptomyces sp. NPDC054802]